MIKNSIKKILILTAILSTQSCVGISVIAQKNDKFNKSQFQLRKERGYFVASKRDKPEWLKPQVSYSKNDILSAWGKPDKKSNDKEYEFWIYKREIGFSGIIADVVISLPILFPSGYRHTILSFKNDELESVTEEYGGKIYQFSCNITMSCIRSIDDFWRQEIAITDPAYSEEIARRNRIKFLD